MNKNFEFYNNKLKVNALLQNHIYVLIKQMRKQLWPRHPNLNSSNLQVAKNSVEENVFSQE